MTKRMKVLLVVLGIAAFTLVMLTTTNKVIYQLDRTGQTLQITPHAYPSQKALYDDLVNQGHEVSDNVVGFAVWSPNDLKCDIYYVTPKYVDRVPMNTMGHELAHCIYGSFHN